MTLYRDININQGASFEKTLIAVDEYDQPIDLSDYVVTARLYKSSAYSSNDEVSMSADATDPAAGEITISMSPMETAALEAFNINRYYYIVDIVSTLSGVDEILRVQEGVATINRDISPFYTEPTTGTGV